MQAPAFDHENPDPFLDPEYTIQELNFIIKNLRVQSSPGKNGIDYRIIIVNTVQCDSIPIIFTPLHVGQLMIFRRLDINVFRNYCYMVRNTYSELV
jgi:hypothetical protein